MVKNSVWVLIFFLASCTTTRFVYIKKLYPFRTVELPAEKCEELKRCKDLIRQHKETIIFYTDQIKRYNESRKNER